jgi:hypothetical protein
MNERPNWKSQLSDASFSIGLLLFMLLALLLPFFAVRDVLANHRPAFGLAEASKLPFLVELIHTAYFFSAILCIFIFFAVTVPALRNQEKKPGQKQSTPAQRFLSLTGCSLLSLLYVVPLVWLLFFVPGYWKLAVDIVLDWLTG